MNKLLGDLPLGSSYYDCDPRQREAKEGPWADLPWLTLLATATQRGLEPLSLSRGVTAPGPCWRDDTATDSFELFLFTGIFQSVEPCFISLLMILYTEKILLVPMLGSLSI